MGFLKGKVTLSQSESTHQFSSPEYYRLFTNNNNNNNKFSQRGGGGESMALQDSPPIKFWRTFNRNPLVSPISRIECRHKSDKFMERCNEDFKSSLHFTKDI